MSNQAWLWSAPAKHSPRQIDELIERIETLYKLGIHQQFADTPDDLLRRYARRLAARSPSAGRLIHEPTRTIEAAYFLRYSLLLNTDRLLLMVRRRVADLYRELLASIGALANDSGVADTQIREQLRSLVVGSRPERRQLELPVNDN